MLFSLLLLPLTLKCHFLGLKGKAAILRKHPHRTPAQHSKDHSQLILPVSIAQWLDPTDNEAKRWRVVPQTGCHTAWTPAPPWVCQGERLTADPTQQWGNESEEEQTRSAINSNKKQLVVTKYYISFPHSDITPFSTYEKGVRLYPPRVWICFCSLLSESFS